MKKIFLIAAFLLISMSSYAQMPGMPELPATSPVPIPPDQWPHTFAATITLDIGQATDVAQLLPTGLTDAWAMISGRAKVNDMETLFVSWVIGSPIRVTALENVTIRLFGK